MWKISRVRRDKPYLSRLKDLSYRPVFVLGEHRSGTTILYKLLALSGSFIPLTTYHALYYDQLLANHLEGKTEKARAELNRFLHDLGLRNRLVDEIELSADYPEEYCFVLQARARSFRLSQRTFHVFDEMCRKLAYTGGQGHTLLLKNPFDFDNFLTIKDLLPDARFVFIHRHPLNTLSSMLQMVRRNWYEGNIYHQLHSRPYTFLQKNAISSGLMRWMLNPNSRLALARRSMIRRIASRAAHYRQNISRLSADDYLSLRYEDLCRSPRAEIERVVAFLGESPATEVKYESLVRPRGLQLTPELKGIEESLRRVFSQAMEYHGYDQREDKGNSQGNSGGG
jgi:hypothetical protein